MPHPLTAHSIRYDGAMNAIRAGTPRAAASLLMDKLPPLWDLSYREMTGGAAAIVEIRVGSLAYRVDRLATPPGEGDDRLVVVYGFSRPMGASREVGRVSGLSGGGLVDAVQGLIGAGHFASHSRGGPMDIEPVPQPPEASRDRREGWSARGVSFRSMEQWCAENPHTFFFARPIYLEDSVTPPALEYGVLRSATELWVERFPT